MFTLYQYLHCPFCVRADMVANFTGVEHKKVFLLNDDDKTCHDLIGAKMVPIMQFEDGSAMGESLDIVEKILSLAPADKQLAAKLQADQVSAIIADANGAINQLLFPRNVMISQPEFETASARQYFQNKKEKMIGMSFDEAFAQSAEAIEQVNTMLAALPVLTLPSQRNQQLSWDDVFIFPVLRNLTMVKGLAWPPAVEEYVTEVAQLTQTHLFTEQAV